MSEEQPEAHEVLTPEDVRTVEFYGDEIAAALIHAEGEESTKKSGGQATNDCAVPTGCTGRKFGYE